MNQPAYIGIDLGGSNIYSVAYSADYKALAESKVDTEAREGYHHVLGRIDAQVKELRAGLARAGYALAAVGLCVPGVVLPEEGRVRIAPNLEWRDVFPLRDLAWRDVKSVLVNDVNAGLVGELSQFSQPPACTLAYFCGTGVGGAIVLHGRLLTGASGGAGEVGHMVVRLGGRRPNENGIRGSLEAYIGKWALNRRIEMRFKSGKKTMLRDTINYNLARTPVKSSSLKKAYEAGDRYCRELMEDYYAKYLGAGISQASNLLEPELVILGGGIMEALGKQLLPHIEKHMRKHCIVQPPELRLARLGDHAGPRGAAVLARAGA